MTNNSVALYSSLITSHLITTNLFALGIAAVAFKNGESRFKTTSVKPDLTEGKGTPKKLPQNSKASKLALSEYTTSIRRHSSSLKKLVQNDNE